MKEKEHLTPQQEIVLRMLINGGEYGVLNFEFPNRYILSYTKRISELRQMGYMIEKRKPHMTVKRKGVYAYVLNKKDKKVLDFLEKYIII